MDYVTEQRETTCFKCLLRVIIRKKNVLSLIIKSQLSLGIAT